MYIVRGCFHNYVYESVIQKSRLVELAESIHIHMRKNQKLVVIEFTSGNSIKRTMVFEYTGQSHEELMNIIGAVKYKLIISGPQMTYTRTFDTVEEASYVKGSLIPTCTEKHSWHIIEEIV